MNLRFAVAALLIIIAAKGQPHSENVDFRNFTFPFPHEALREAPDHLKWMDPETISTITLVNGRWDSNPEQSSNRPSATLSRVYYGYLTMSGQLDAVVVVNYHTGGSANALSSSGRQRREQVCAVR